MDGQLRNKRILVFLAFVFGISWITILVIYLTFRAEDLIKVGAIVGLLIGISPALANILTRLITKEGWKKLWLRPNLCRTSPVRDGWRFYLAACLLPGRARHPYWSVWSGACGTGLDSSCP